MPAFFSVLFARVSLSVAYEEGTQVVEIIDRKTSSIEFRPGYSDGMLESGSAHGSNLLQPQFFLSVINQCRQKELNVYKASISQAGVFKFLIVVQIDITSGLQTTCPNPIACWQLHRNLSESFKRLLTFLVTFSNRSYMHGPHQYILEQKQAIFPAEHF